MPATLRNRVLLSLCVVFALSAGCQYMIGQWVIYPRFLELERAEATENVERAAQVLEHELDQLLPSVSDWAVWDESYRFVQDSNRSFASSNLTASALQALAINVLAFYDREGKRLWLGTDALSAEDQEALAEITPTRFPRSAQELQQDSPDSALGRLSWTPHGLFLVGYRSILKSSGDGPPMGAILMARFLDESSIARLGSQVGVDMRLSAPEGDGEPAPPKHSIGRLTLTPIELREMPSVIEGKTTLIDVDGRPTLTLAISRSREIAARGQEALWLTSLSLAIAGGVVLNLLMGLLHRMVIAPLSLLTRHAIQLGTSDELTARLDLGRSDEIGVLADAFDRMTASLAQGRQRLLDRLSVHMDNSPLAVIELDAQWRIIRWSGEAERLFGWKAEEVLERRFDEIDGLFPHDLSLIETTSTDAHDGLQTSTTYTQRHFRKDGAIVDCVWYDSALYDQAGQLTSLLLLVQDITERKRFEETLARYKEQLEQQVAERTKELELSITALAEARDQAEAANDAKSAFLASMSHEIRTPMNAVLGLAELLGTTSLDVQQQHFVETIQRSGETLLEVINDILDFSKIETGKLTLELHDFDLHKLLEEAVQLFSESASAKGLLLTTGLPWGLPERIHGDSTRLRQILVNLIGNAVKFTDHGEIKVRASVTLRADERMLLSIEVQDTGPGIPPELHSRIFEAFAQGDGSTTRQHGGTGLGLAICRQLAELMGGTIRVDSSPGQGACFTLEVPFAPPCEQSEPVARAASPDAAPPAPLPWTTLSGRVLLVEDNDVNREMAILMLEGLGLEVVTAANGAEAVQAVQESGRFTLALMDCQMPVMDGLSATRAIRAWEQSSPDSNRRLPIIALTANVEKGVYERCTAAGMDGYISKPFSQAKLREAILAWLAPQDAQVSPAMEDPPTPLEILDRTPMAAIRALQQPGQPDPLERIVGLYLNSASMLLVPRT